MARKSGRKSWLARKFLTTKRSFPDVEGVGVESAIAALARNASVALFQMEEIQLGALVGEGDFTQVYSVAGFALDDPPQDGGDWTKMKQRRDEIKERALSETQLYAVKQLNKKAFKDKNNFRRGVRKLINEAKILGMLVGEPPILKLRALNIDVVENCRNYEDFFMLTDRVQDTLANRITAWRKESLDKGEAPNDDRVPIKGNYAYQMARAIKACHDSGIMIRDLTPDNIGFTDKHTVRLFDLGNAKVVGVVEGQNVTDDDNAEELVGSRRYMDSHVWMTGEYLFKSDVYSWAIIFYEMLNETKPYEGLSSLEHQQLVCLKGQRPSLTVCYIPPLVDTLLTEAWNPEIDKRLTSDAICNKMQNFLLNLDACYYDQNEDDFLLDLEFKQETVSNFGDDKWFEDDDRDEDRMGSMYHEDLIRDDSSDYTGTDHDDTSYVFHQHSQSKLSDGSSFLTFASSVKADKPTKLVSSAA